MKQEPETSPTKSETEAETETEDAVAPTKGSKPVYVKVKQLRPDGYESSCLRPLGLCTLGGCCDTCWYRPNHPRFSNNDDG